MTATSGRHSRTMALASSRSARSCHELAVVEGQGDDLDHDRLIGQHQHARGGDLLPAMTKP